MCNIQKLFVTITQLFALVLFVSSQTTIPEDVLSQRFIDPENLIHLGDLIDVDFVGSTEFDWRGTLNPEGLIDSVGFSQNSVNALCKSEENVAAEVANLFAKTLRNPNVVVKILDRSNRSLAYIYGAIKTPQRFKMKRKALLNELVILSGGITEKASGEIQIFRPAKANCESISNQETEILNIKISDLIKGKPDSNPQIRLGDIITIKEADPIYIIGGVLNPRQLLFREKMTLSRAIAAVGGLAPNATLKQITIFRRIDGVSKTILVDFELISSKKMEDIELQKYDIVEIGVEGDQRKFTPLIKGFGEKDKESINLPIRIIE